MTRTQVVVLVAALAAVMLLPCTPLVLGAALWRLMPVPLRAPGRPAAPGGLSGGRRRSRRPPAPQPRRAPHPLRRRHRHAAAPAAAELPPAAAGGHNADGAVPSLGARRHAVPAHSDDGRARWRTTRTCFGKLSYGGMAGAAFTAASAARAAHHAGGAGIFPGAEDLTLDTVAGCLSFFRTCVHDDPDTLLAADFHRLAALDTAHCPDRGKPVNPSEAGPLGALWPRGEPWSYRQWGAMPRAMLSDLGAS
jgi:hypothetical protein